MSPLIGPSPEKKDYPENQKVQEDLYGGHDKVLVISEDSITQLRGRTAEGSAWEIALPSAADAEPTVVAVK